MKRKISFFFVVLNLFFFFFHKPENILLACDKEVTLVKVSDFGLSKFVDAETMMKTFCGTMMYVAPEILLTHGRGAYTCKVDVWSLGVILYTCLSALTPFNNNNPKICLYEQITQGAYNFPQSRFENVDEKAKDLVRIFSLKYLFFFYKIYSLNFN